MQATRFADRTDEGLELSGLDVLELAGRAPRTERAARLWSATWPKAAAAAMLLLLWQLVVWSGRYPEYVLPGPSTTLRSLSDGVLRGDIPRALTVTLERAAVGFGIALVIGVGIGAVVSRVRVLRVAVGSLITGLQTMPSIAWFPLAIVLFQISEGAILFVVVLGAAPAIANGLIAGSDNVAPILVRAGRVLGASRWSLYRHVVLPASVPSFVGGVKQGWAFAWRSLMAGELIVVIGTRPSIGFLLQSSRDLSAYADMMSVMLVILLVGIAVDSVLFGSLERAIRSRWGLSEQPG